ncbi:response regulator [Ketobacter sp. MCCC 1A13808]|nr:response regulator [Ketobacter sp. MCCC 1A13808]
MPREIVYRLRFVSSESNHLNPSVFRYRQASVELTKSLSAKKTALAGVPMAVPDQTRIILLVEDDVDLRNIMSQSLQALNYGAIVAENGLQALAYLRQCESLPFAILTDLMMPVMDGWSMLEELRKDNSFSKVPVIVVSATAGDMDAATSVSEYLRKPIRIHELSAALERVSPRRDTT